MLCSRPIRCLVMADRCDSGGGLHGRRRCSRGLRRGEGQPIQRRLWRWQRTNDRPSWIGRHGGWVPSASRDLSEPRHKRLTLYARRRSNGRCRTAGYGVRSRRSFLPVALPVPTQTRRIPEPLRTAIHLTYKRLFARVCADMDLEGSASQKLLPASCVTAFVWLDAFVGLAMPG